MFSDPAKTFPGREGKATVKMFFYRPLVDLYQFFPLSATNRYNTVELRCF